MSTVTRIDNWSGGADNRNDRARIIKTDGGSSFCEGVNIDVMACGRIISRSGFEKAVNLVTDGNTAVQIAGHKDHLVVLERQSAPTVCGKLIKQSLVNGLCSEISTVAHTVRMAACIHNDEMLISMSNGDAWRMKDGEVRQWGVPMSYQKPLATRTSSGNLEPGIYKYSMTFVNSLGEESGAVIVSQITLDAAHKGILFSSFSTPIPEGCKARLYVSPVNSSSMYLQREFTEYSDFQLMNVRANSLALDSKFMRSLPPAADILCSYKGVVLAARDNVVWVSQPMRIHLFDMATGFFQFPVRVTNMIGVEAGVFITTTSHTYLLSNPETVETSLREIYDVGAVANSAIRFKEDKVAWLTEYGQAIGTNEGGLELPHKDKYSPVVAQESAVAVIKNDGAEMIVTSMRQPLRRSTMTTSDYFDADVVAAVKSTASQTTVGMADEYEADTP